MMNAYVRHSVANSRGRSDVMCKIEIVSRIARLYIRRRRVQEKEIKLY